MISALRAALNTDAADYLDIRAITGWETRIEARGKQVTFVVHRPIWGMHVRALVHGSWGSVSVEDSYDLGAVVRQAARIACALGPGSVRLASTSVVEATLPWPQVERRPDQVSLDEKVALVQAYARVLCSTSIPMASVVRYTDIAQTQSLVTSEGCAIVQPQALAVMEVEVTVRDGLREYRAIEEFGGTPCYDDLQAQEEAGIKAARRATALSQAEQLPPGRYDVVCDGALTGLLAHEVVGHLLEADVVGSSVELVLQLRPGARIAWEGLTIVDDPATAAEGHYQYDDEGVAGKRVMLVDAGKVSSYLHSRQTAAHFDVVSNGHARAVGYTFGPLVRMSNTFVLPGDVGVDRLFEGVERGVYARGTRGAIGGRYFALEPQEAYLIEHGKIAHRVQGIRLCGDAFTTLRDIDAVADDFNIFSGGLGGCYKGGQGPLRTASGGPHIRIRSVQIEDCCEAP